MDYKKIYERQYGQKALTNVPLKQFWGIRKILSKYDLDRYAVAERLVEPGRRVLDIGCGDGFFLQKVKHQFSELYGIDVTPSRVQEGQAQIRAMFPEEAAKFTFVAGNADDPLPFSDSFFDTITCLAVLEHVFDIFSLVGEINRVLKPGGQAIVQVPNIAYLKHRSTLLLGRLPITSSPYNWEEIGWDGGHLHYFTLERLVNLFERSGFRVTWRGGSGFLAEFRRVWTSLLSADLIIKAYRLA